MVSEVIRERLKQSIRKFVRVFILDSNFCYEGKLTNIDDEYLEVLTEKHQTFKIIKLTEIKDIEVKP